MARLSTASSIVLLWILVAIVPARAGGDDVRLIVHGGDDVKAMLARLVGEEGVARTLEHNGLSADGVASPGQELVVPATWIVDVETSSAEMLYLCGEVTIRTAGGSSLPAGVGARLQAGDTVVTGADGTASLRLIGADDSLDHDHLYVEASSELAIEQLLVSEDKGWRSAVARLFTGAIEVVTSRSAETRKQIEVETPTAIGGVRGTEFRMEVVPAGEDGLVATRLETTVGQVAFFASGAEVTVGEGYGSLAREGETPTAPRPLPKAPVLTAPAMGSAVSAFDFRWESVDGAAVYLLEIAEDTDFLRTVLQVEITEPGYAPATAMLPIRHVPFHWRVTATDADGFRSPASPSRTFVIDL